MNSQKRTIVIGDVHGCWNELKDLLDAVHAGPQDDLISVGDLIAKGPDSANVLEWAMNCENLRCVAGNHEERLLRGWRNGALPSSKPYDAQTAEQLGPAVDRYMNFIATWPLFLDAGDFAIVHAGVNPRNGPLARQNHDDLVSLRKIDEIPWYELYEGSQLIVFGHWAKPDAVWRPNAIGLDTGCVYGGALTALILPERRLVSVPAHRSYRPHENFAVKK